MKIFIYLIALPKTNWVNNRVKLLNKQGQFQLSFSKKNNGQLNSPTGVCVVDQFVYVDA